MLLSQRWASLSTMWGALFRDHEIFVRTGGEVRFIRLSATLQRRVAATIAVALGLWALFTIGMVAWQASAAYQQRDVAARAVIVQRAEARVAAESNRVEDVVRRLDARQDYLDGVFKSHFGDDVPANPPATPAAQDATPPATGADKLSQLRAIGQRQQGLALALTSAVSHRSTRAELALRAVGIRASAGTQGQGGPFIPAEMGRTIAPPRDPAFQRLAAAIDRMERLEQ
ncbi:MAG: hypothetical protein ACKOUM_11770, partial [Sphingopyxis sp.]